MRTYELIKETFFRKLYIPVLHIIWFALYILVFFTEVRREVQLGENIFVLSGFILPLFLSAGIFGDDIATGRISVLITKPMQINILYISRVLGLSLQCVLHLVIAGCIAYITHSITGNGNLNNLGLWLFLTWLLFTAWIALSTTLSVVTKRISNSTFLVSAVFFYLVLMNHLDPNYLVTIAIRAIVKYAFPPVQLLCKFGDGGYEGAQKIGCLIHVVGLTILYCIIGIILLSKREFKSERD